MRIQLSSTMVLDQSGQAGRINDGYICSSIEVKPMIIENNKNRIAKVNGIQNNTLEINFKNKLNLFIVSLIDFHK